MSDLGESSPTPKQHDTLSKQVPNRQVLVSDQIDDKFGETPVSLLDVDFDALLAKERELRSSTPVWEGIDQTIIQKLDNLSENQIATFFPRVLERVNTETQYLHELNELGVLYSLMTSKRIEGVRKINWGRVMISPEGSISNKFNPITRVISIVEDKSSLKDIVLQIAQDGMLPNSIQNLNHEVTHAFQFENKNTFLNCIRFIFDRDKLLQELKTEQAVSEAQAFRNTGERSVDKNTTLDVLNRLASFRDYSDSYQDTTDEQFLYSLEAVDKLKALGFSEKEIAGMVQKCGEWDSERGIYPTIQAEIDKKSNDLHLDEYDVQNLVLADKIERRIDRLRAMQIVREELTNLK